MIIGSTYNIGHYGEQLTLNQWVLGSSPRWCTRKSLTENVGLFFCCHNPECRNSLCTIGGREQLRRRPPPAAETGSRSRGRGRRGGVPPKGSRPMRAPQPVRAGRESPRGVGKKPRRCGGRGFTVTKDSLTQSVGLFFIAVIRDKENAAGSRSRSTGLA